MSRAVALPQETFPFHSCPWAFQLRGRLHVDWEERHRAPALAHSSLRTYRATTSLAPHPHVPRAIARPRDPPHDCASPSGFRASVGTPSALAISLVMAERFLEPLSRGCGLSEIRRRPSSASSANHSAPHPRTDAGAHEREKLGGVDATPVAFGQLEQLEGITSPAVRGRRPFVTSSRSSTVANVG